MKLEAGQAAIVTGAGSGIGRALCLEFARRGLRVTAVDFCEAAGLETERLAREQQQRQQQEVAQGHGGPAPAAAEVVFLQCDVSDAASLAAVFASHMTRCCRLDICVNNAGIGEKEWFVNDSSSDGSGAWRQVLNVNLTAVVDGTRLAVQCMQRSKNKNSQGGAIINVASAAGLYPSPSGPVYSASKGGVVLFTRSLAHLSKSSIRVNAICPEFIETGIISQVTGPAARHFADVIKSLGGFIPMQTVVDAAIELIEDDSRAGECMWITNRLGKQWWPTEEEKQRYLVPNLPGSSQTKPSSKEQSRSCVRREQPVVLPKRFQKIVVHRLSSNFSSATSIVFTPLPLFPTLHPFLPSGSFLVRVAFAGINASDVNFSAGRYFGSEKEAAKKLPFDAGFEAVGVVVATAGKANSQSSPSSSSPARSILIGQPVAFLTYGAFSEYCVVDIHRAIPVDEVSPQVVALLTSGLTASIALSEAGRMTSGETVLVTAAAGGTGQFAVQLAKLAGNRVVATCSGSEEKQRLLRELGADRVVNYSAEDVGEVVRREFPPGANIIYESVGGSIFASCLSCLARHGRLIIIGMMSQYTSGAGGSWAEQGHPGLAEKLLWKSQTVVGFFLLHYTKLWAKHWDQLYKLYKSGKLKVAIDPSEFVGLHSVAAAVDHLQSGRSVGKVVVKIDPSFVSQARL